MPSDALDGKILCFEIVGAAGGVAEGEGVVERLLVGDDERGDVVAGRNRAGGELVDAGFLGESAEAAEGVGVEGAHAFGDVVDGFEEVLVLFFEGFMEGEEAGAFDVPVRVMGQRHERVGIGEEEIQRGDDGGVGFGGFGGCVGERFHASEYVGGWEVINSKPDDLAALEREGGVWKRISVNGCRAESGRRWRPA